MSNIFYSQVDANLQQELNARGVSGFSRTTKDLQYMLEKVANVQLTAYSGSTYTDSAIVRAEHGVLGGTNVRSGRYLPSGPEGYLTETTYDAPSYITLTDGKAVLTPGAGQIDRSGRIAPYITSCDVQIGDHSMGLLNKATIAISIPNPQRDLDGIEDVWFRPGRNVKIKIEQAQQSVITEGLLSPTIIPDSKKLQELYEPSTELGLVELSKDLRRMNEFNFYGLITSFEFSYQSNGTVDATISLTGTSNVYTDVSMWLKTPTDAEKASAAKEEKKIDLPGYEIDSANKIQPPTPGTTPTDTKPTAKTEFYTTLSQRVDVEISKWKSISNLSSSIVPLTNYAASTDRFILFGESYPQNVDNASVINYQQQNAVISQSNAAAITQFNADVTASLAQSASLAAGGIGNPIPMPKNPVLKPTASIDLIKSYDTTPESNYSRYITLGSLIEFINIEIVSKITGNVSAAKIDCDDTQCSSNYYEQLTSCTPNSILLMPEDPKQSNGINSYGNLTYYKNIDRVDPNWPGIQAKLTSEKIRAIGTETAPTVFKPSRIFINMEVIQDILLGADGKSGLTAGGSKSFTLRSFMISITNKISYATGGAILMQLMTHPTDQSKMLYTDVKFLKTIEDAKFVKVTPYSVPMFANHEFGTIVRDFSMKARLPENAKNLSYVLNSGDDISEEDIAPYMNFMYNAKDPDAVNAMIANYKKKHENNLIELAASRIELGLAPMIPEKQQSMYKSLTNFVKYPTNDITKSQQITAPIFPFDAEFTIDGINGFRYGDVLKFAALPTKYTANTVFSIIGITHTVGSDGSWTTLIRCIMRPSLE
jgi:hypothetical protein